MKIITEYDEQTGILIDKSGGEWNTAPGIHFKEYKEYKEKKEQNLIQLIDAGMSAYDLIKLKANGVI